jgi:hypothetical protein
MYAKPHTPQTNTHLPCAKNKGLHDNARLTCAGNKTNPAKARNFWKTLGVLENFKKQKSFQLFSIIYLEN